VKLYVPRVLVISQYFPPDITAAAFRIGELVKYLSESGRCVVSILTTTPHKTKNNSYHQEFISEKQVTRMQISSKSHLKQYLQFLRSCRKHLSQIELPDVVIASSPPISVFQIAKKYVGKTLFILDIRDLWPDSPVAAGKLKKGIVYKYFKRYERSMYKKANAITAVSEPMAQYIKHVVPDKSIHVIYNGIPRRDYETALTQKEEREPSKHLNIIYAGNIGLLQGMQVVPEAITLIDDLDIHFEIIGDGVLKSQLQDALEKRVAFRKPMPRDELLEYLRERADVLFFNLKKDPILEKTIPSKLFDYLLLSRPIITGIKGEGREILKKTGAAVFFEQDSAISLVDAIKEMERNYDIYYSNARKNCLNIAKNFIREDMYKKILEIILENES